MKHLKITSALLSAIMCMTLVMTPVAVMADEAATEETQVEETEKPAPKETEKQEPETVEDREIEDEADNEAVDAAVLAKGKCGAKLNWSLNDTGVLTISGKGGMYAYSKTSPAPWQEHADKITKVVVSKNVTTIGAYAFYNCANLTSVSLPNTLKAIYDYAFAYCKALPKVVIPSKVNTIGVAAFSNCSILASINIPKGVTKINDNTFTRCGKLTAISIPASVKTIGVHAFSRSGLTSISIPKGVTTIDSYAFYICLGLTGVSIPASVKSIGENAFASCSALAEVNIPVSGLNSIGKNAFKNDSKIKYLDIPLSVTYIGDYAFSGCTGLSQVWINKTQHNNASTGAFSNVPSAAFAYHDYLIIGNQFSVGDFTYAVSNPAIDGTGTVDMIAVGFDVEKAVIPSVVESNHAKYKVTRISRFTSQYNSERKLKYLVIGSNIASIDDEAFAGCPELISVTGGAKLSSIGTKAFERCPKLRVFKLTSKSLKRIGPYAFFGDRALKTLYVKKTKKLTKSGVKNSLKGSSVKTVKVKKSKIKKYKKIFKKKNSGKKVKVKK